MNGLAELEELNHFHQNHWNGQAGSDQPATQTTPAARDVSPYGRARAFESYNFPKLSVSKLLETA